MRIYIITREKADFSFTLLCANFKTVVDAISSLDGTDEKITVNFTEVADVTQSKMLKK